MKSSLWDLRRGMGGGEAEGGSWAAFSPPALEGRRVFSVEAEDLEEPDEYF